MDVKHKTTEPSNFHAEKNTCLTEDQRKLVTENHNLIYGYAYNKKILIDDYYDILAIGLCKAAKTFDQDKGKFSTLAYRCMENEINEYWRNTQRKSCIPEDIVVSYNRENFCNQDSLLEYLIDHQASESLLYEIISSEFVDLLTDRENTIYQYLLMGLAHNEIADKLGCKKQSIAYHIKNIRGKLLNYLSYK